MFAGLGLVFTLVPLFPFHLPFASLVSFSHGALSGLWTTVFLSLGLAELTQLQTHLSEGMPAAISWLALGSALYASFKSLGQTPSSAITRLRHNRASIHVVGAHDGVPCVRPLGYTIWVSPLPW